MISEPTGLHLNLQLAGQMFNQHPLPTSSAYAARILGHEAPWSVSIPSPSLFKTEPRQEHYFSYGLASPPLESTFDEVEGKIETCPSNAMATWDAPTSHPVWPNDPLNVSQFATGHANNYFPVYDSTEMLQTLEGMAPPVAPQSGVQHFRVQELAQPVPRMPNSQLVRRLTDPGKKKSEQSKASRQSDKSSNRTPHNIIERRYRDHLNAQIDLLRESLSSVLEGEHAGSCKDVPKAVIIQTAAEFISDLKSERARMRKTITDLQAQVTQLSTQAQRQTPPMAHKPDLQFISYQPRIATELMG